MKRAILYQQLENNRVDCQLCAHRCRISVDKRGVCGVRENRDGTLYSLNYGKIIAQHTDPIEKKPLYHFLPGAEIYSISAPGCNFRCEFCQNWQISQITKGKSGRVVGEKRTALEIVSAALKHDCQAIAYTYTEPTVFFEFAQDVAQLAHEKNLKNVFVTNGFQTPEAIAKMKGLIDAANIDLKAFSDDYYRQVCGARLQPVLTSIKQMWEADIWVEVTTLVVPGKNDSKQELTQIAEFIASVSPDIPWHVSRFFPQYKMSDVKPTPLEKLELACKVGKKAGLKFVYTGNTGASESNQTLCPACGKIVIERTGYYTQVNLEQGACPDCGQKLPGVFE